ncbi:MAG: heme-binding domain-containing protein [Myxococcales bacterium]|nr:heme-binding domain-containing protein [Myxococcales bacterium]
MRTIGLVGIGLFLVAQLVPYGRAHTNPPVVQEPAWDRPATRALAVRACFDCHSNETRWPWYAHVAPMSWLVQRDVDVGRRVMNFSEWNRRYEEADEAAETVLEGEMPLGVYLLLHPSARLSVDEKRALADGLAATVGTESRAHEHDDERD